MTHFVVHVHFLCCVCYVDWGGGSFLVWTKGLLYMRLVQDASACQLQSWKGGYVIPSYQYVYTILILGYDFRVVGSPAVRTLCCLSAVCPQFLQGFCIRMKEKDSYYKLYNVKAECIQHLCPTSCFGIESMMQNVSTTTLMVWSSNCPVGTSSGHYCCHLIIRDVSKRGSVIFARWVSAKQIWRYPRHFFALFCLEHVAVDQLSSLALVKSEKFELFIYSCALMLQESDDKLKFIYYINFFYM